MDALMAPWRDEAVLVDTLGLVIVQSKANLRGTFLLPSSRFFPLASVLEL